VLAERKLENLNAGKSEAKNKNIPQHMLQTVNGLCKPIKMQQMSVGEIKSYLLMIRDVLSKMMIEGDEAFAKVCREFGVKVKIMKQ